MLFQNFSHFLSRFFLFLKAIQRIQNRNGLTEVQVKQRIAAQPSNDEMIKESTVVFSTQWSYEFSLKQVITLDYSCCF